MDGSREKPLSNRQVKSRLRVVFCIPKGYGATEKARSGGNYNHSMVELLLS